MKSEYIQGERKPSLFVSQTMETTEDSQHTGELIPELLNNTN